MNINTFNNEIYQPSIDKVSSIIGIPRSEKADILLLSIAGQESAWTHRYQISSRKGRKGPARGFWQFEKNGGVVGVMSHPWSRDKARNLVKALSLKWDKTILWRELETNDLLSTGFARLLLWTDAQDLPSTSSTSWRYYIRNWRPGKPHPRKWKGIWTNSYQVIKFNKRV